MSSLSLLHAACFFFKEEPPIHPFLANLSLFAGLIYRMVKPKVVLLIFVSGKIVLTGAKVRTDIYEAFENIYPVLTEFKKS